MSESRPDILTRILQRKSEEIAACRQQVSVDQLQQEVQTASPPRGFINALRDKQANGLSAVIAEIKKASPSQGVIREDFDPVQIAES